MVRFLEDIANRVKKGLIPKDIFLRFFHAFQALDLTKDLTLFDIKHLKAGRDVNHQYFRMRKGKYRAIFYIEGDEIFVIALDKREEVYRKWE